MTLIRKVTAAKAAAGDDLEFVLSDGTKDRYGDVIDPAGWDLASFRRNPIALFNHDGKFPIGSWDKVRVEGARLLGRLKLATEGTSERIDEILRLVEQGILRAVSVGFRPLEVESLKDNSGLFYKRQELLETSLVSVPANPSAVQLARSLHVSDDTIALVFGKLADGAGGVVRRGSPGGHAESPHLPRSRTMNIPLSKRIEDAQVRLVAFKDQLTDHLATFEDGDPDEAALAVTDELNGKIASQQRSLDALKAAEVSLAGRSTPVGAGSSGGPRSFAQAKSIKPIDLFFRRAAVRMDAATRNRDPEDILRARYGDDEATAMVVRAAVAGATTTASGWAAELVNTVMTDFIESLRPVSVYPGLAAAGGGRLTFGPGQGAIKIPSRAATPSIGGSFVGEGAPIPVRRLGLGTTTLIPHKVGVISVFSREIARYSNPAIEGVLRRAITDDTAITLDSLLLDAGAASAVRPPGLLNGVTALTATAGGGAAAILSDLRKLRAPFDAVSAGNGLVLLANPAQMEALALTPGDDGSLGWADAVMARYNPLVSTAIPAGRLIMVRAVDFATATGDTPDFELSDQTVLHMEDSAPAQIGVAGTPNVVAAPVQSMFQTAQTAMRMLMDVSWAMTRPGMVQFLDGATW